MKKLTAIAMCTGLMITASGSVLADGAATYDKACKACHMTGAAGSPKIGDKAAWEPRIAQGMDVLYDHAINGFDGDAMTPMLPKGGRMDLSDQEVRDAVDYMIEESS